MIQIKIKTKLLWLEQDEGPDVLTTDASPCPWLWGRWGVKGGRREITDDSSPGKGTTKTQEGCDPI